MTNDRNVPLGDLRQHLKAQLQEGGQVTCLIVMCFNEQQRLFRVDVLPSLRGRRDGPVADVSTAIAKSGTAATSHVSLLREPST